MGNAHEDTLPRQRQRLAYGPRPEARMLPSTTDRRPRECGAVRRLSSCRRRRGPGR